MQQTTETIINVEKLKAGYDNTVILEDTSFKVKRGEIFVILGGSGCGKSTLLKNMIGLHQPMAGNVYIDGKNITKADETEKQEICKSFGVMYQNGALWGAMNVLENLRLPLEEYTNLPLDAMNLLCEMKLKLVGLDGYSHLMPAELSGGMKKRVAIARAMILDAEIIFLDEPSAGLDPITSAELDQLILHLSRALKITFVVVTHELESIYTIADNVIMLDKRAKKIVAQGNPKELRDRSQDPWVRQFFHRLAKLDGK